MKDVIVRFAKFEDADQMIRMSEAYYYESMFHEKVAYDPETLVRTIGAAIELNCAIVAVEGDEVIGMVLCGITRTIFKSGDLGVDVFYVKPEWRGTGCGNALQDAIQMIIDKTGVATAYEGSTSGFGHRTETQFTNMLKKRGWYATGPTCIYINPNCEEAIK